MTMFWLEMAWVRARVCVCPLILNAAGPDLSYDARRACDKKDEKVRTWIFPERRATVLGSTEKKAKSGAGSGFYLPNIYER